MKSPKSMTQLAVLAMAALIAIESTGMAQGRGERRGGRGGFELSAITLVGLDDVQKELNVTDEQKESIGRVSESFGEKSRELFSGLRDLSREERRQKSEELAPKREQLATDAEKQLAEVLNETQMKRLNEILIQVLGARALQREGVVQALQLNDEQQAKIKEVLGSEQDKMRQLFADARSGKIQRDAMRDKMTAMRDEINAQAAAVLSPEQKAQLEQMKGKPFELQLRRSGRRS